VAILIDKIRVKNFRALQDVEVDLKSITLLVGANNAGKTTLLRALNTVLGVSRTQLNKDDLFIDKAGNQPANSIIIDVRIVPIDVHGQRVTTFEEPWRSRLGGQEIFQSESRLYEYVAFRAEYSFGREDAPLPTTYKLITDWQGAILGDEFNRITQIRSLLPMYLIDAQRDLQEDLKLRTSFFGKLVSQLERDYSEADLATLHQLIEELNNTAVSNSEVLSHLKIKLSELNRTTQTRGAGISINPFPKKIRDLHKGMKVDFQDNGSDSFGMEYHGMGTRSWASILTLGAYLDWELQQIAQLEEANEYFQPIAPIIGLEEPEAHLHPNAQRTLYSQMKTFAGQKIISTHSPYIAGQADLTELRHFYKAEDKAVISQILFRTEEDLEIQRLLDEIQANGGTPEINRQNQPIIANLRNIAKSKINEEEGRKIRKEIMQSKGELLFSKILVFFEGVTEEIALPVLLQHYPFGESPFERGVNFVGVGGKENYKPFLYVSKFLKIPCLVLSDGDGDTEQKVKAQILDVFGSEFVDLFVLDEGSDFEKYLLDTGLSVSVDKAIDVVEGIENYLDNKYIPDLNGQKRKGGTIREYTSQTGRIEAILDCMRENKTKYAEEIATQIVQSLQNDTDLQLPPKIRELFEKISEKLGINHS
jgi:putative ATP-dependent endonuclease of the OLD family